MLLSEIRIYLLWIMLFYYILFAVAQSRILYIGFYSVSIDIHTVI